MRKTLSAFLTLGAFVVFATIACPVYSQLTIKNTSLEANGACNNAKSEENLLQCRKKRFLESEKNIGRLLAALQKSYRESEPRLAAYLNKSQVKWKAYKDADCELKTFYSRSGSAYEVYKFDCLATMNFKRSEDLQRLLDTP